MKRILMRIAVVQVILLSSDVAPAADYYWTGTGGNNADGNKEWANPGHWSLDGYTTGTIPAVGPTLGSSASPYDNIFLKNAGTTYLGGIAASSGTYQRIQNLTVDGGDNRIGGRYTTDTPDLRIDGDFTVAAGAQFFTGPYSPNRIDFYGAFTVGNGSAIGINNNTSDGGYWNLAGATSISLQGVTIRYMTNNWQWNVPRWNFGAASITLANTNTFNLEQDVVNVARDGVASRGALQQSISNTISGTGGIAKTGAATLILDNAANSYSGATTISEGILQVYGGGAIGDLSAVTLADVQTNANEGSVRTTLSLNDSETIGSLAGGGATGGNVILNGNTLTVGGNDSSTSYGGVIAGSATGATQVVSLGTGSPYTPAGYIYAPEPVLGAGSLVKTGAGTLTLTGANLYSEATTISAGAVLANNTSGSATGTSAVQVQAGASLGGSGAIGGVTTVQADGTLSPGGDANTSGFGLASLHFEGDLHLQADATLLWQFLNAGTPGQDYDSMTGTNLILPEMGTVHLEIMGLDGHTLNAGDSFTLFDGDVYHDTTLLSLGTDITDLFQIHDNTGWWGTWEVTAGSLVLTAVPEPATWLLLVILLTFCGLRPRRLRQANRPH